ncbi:hypothetical protein [Pseudomonas nunensis]|nr:hypothetical protein [Pseudomonas nunensis]
MLNTHITAMQLHDRHDDGFEAISLDMPNALHPQTLLALGI